MAGWAVVIVGMGSLHLHSHLRKYALGISVLLVAAGISMAADGVPEVPKSARVALSENWSSGKIDPAKWYVPRKMWGHGNSGVNPENVFIARDTVGGREQNVLVCEAHGDLYDGSVVGYDGVKTRVGGVIVSKEFFASGRFEIVMKIGDSKAHDGGPADPRQLKGCIPALWTYAYRYLSGEAILGATGLKELTSEIDFPELGKGGDFAHGLYNCYLQTRDDCKVYEVNIADGQYHTFVTEWRTKLEPIDGISDAHVKEYGGFWWITDKAVPLAKHDLNPLKKLGENKYAIYRGATAEHWIDGKKVGENVKFVPAMAAQLNIGVWLPNWAGKAEWKTARVSFASVKIWQYDDPGDVRGILTADLDDNYDKSGNALKK